MYDAKLIQQLIERAVAEALAQVDIFESEKVIRFLRLPAVKERTGLSTSSIYDGMAKGTFPLCFHTSERRVAWLESEIVEWMKARAAQPYVPRGALARPRVRTNEKASTRKNTGGGGRE
jgi:prophage regulatory protein